jgi:Adenylate and Guanylate cyclase catalytic domain
VRDATREGWEAYEIKTRHVYDTEFAQDQMQQALQDDRFNRTGVRHLQQAAQPVEFDMFGVPLSNSITNMQPDGSMMPAPQDSGPYLPVWQTSPLVPLKSVLNFNALSHPAGKGAYEELIRSQQAVLGMAENLNQEHFGQTGLYFKLLLSMSQYRADSKRFLSEPTTSLAYPIFDLLDPVTRTLVGVMGTQIYWRVNFQNVLPPNARGVICVISNTLNQTFTYRIDGEEPTFLGNGDLHDPQYDEFVQSADVNTYLQAHTSIETQSYSSVDLNENFCGYSIHIYPSQDTQDQFLNDQPFHFSLLVVGVFCLTSLVFITYDCSVARRHRIVMDRAVTSSAIVSSLFPPQVRQRLYQESMEQHHHHHHPVSKELEQARQQKFNPNLWKVDQAPNSGEGGQPSALTYSSKPIANLFRNTTVLFADMAGFTAWSSTHTPEQVFELLERVYSAFDKIANRRKVFKVETIGDCYVAVVCIVTLCICLPPPAPRARVRFSHFSFFVLWDRLVSRNHRRIMPF